MKNRRIELLVCLVCLFILFGEGVKGYCVVHLGVPANETEEIHKEIIRGLDALYNGNFEKATATFSALITEYPNDPKGYFSLALTARWLTRIDPASTTYQQDFERAVDASISACTSILTRHPDHAEASTFLTASYGYRAEYYNFLKHQWNKAYDDGVKMREYLKKAQEVPSPTIDLNLGEGLYNYYAYRYRDKIGWWRFLLSLPKGDRDKGIGMLEDLRRDGFYTQVEAWYFLIEIYKDEPDYKERAIALSEGLYQEYPGNPFFHTLLAGVYHRYHDWEHSLHAGQRIIEMAGTSPYYSDYLVYQAKYLVGESSFFLKHYDEALRIFNDIITSAPPDPEYLLPWSHLRRGTIFSINGNKDEAVKEFKLVLKMDDAHNVHKLAKGLLKNLRSQ